LKANKEKIKRCYVYSRLSTEDQHRRAEYSSLKSQEKICRAYIASQEPNNWRYIRIYSDLSSGGDTSKQGLRDLIQDIRNNKVDIVVTTKMDRLTRNIKDFWTIYEIMQKYNCQFVCATQELNSTTAHGRFFINILMSFAEFELETIRERTRAKMLAQAEEGLWHGGRPPFGYDRNKERKGYLIPNKDESVAVKKIFELFIKLGSPAAVAKEINRLGYRTKSKTKAKFSKWAITYILSNPLYVGQTYFRGNVYNGKHKALIQKRRFNHVQTMLERNKQTRTSPLQNKYDFRLRGILKCGYCGSTMTPSPAKSGKYLYYTCTKVSKFSKKECRVRRIGARAIEDAVVEKLSEIGTNEVLVSAAVKKANKQSIKQVTSKKRELRMLKKKLREFDASIVNLISYIEKHGTLTKSAEGRLGKLENEKELLINDIQKLEFEIEGYENYNIDAELLTKTIRNFGLIYDELSPAEQSRLLHLMLQEVTLNEDSIKLSLYSLGNSGKTLEYLLERPEFTESDKKLPERNDQHSYFNVFSFSRR